QPSPPSSPARCRSPSWSTPTEWIGPPRRHPQGFRNTGQLSTKEDFMSVIRHRSVPAEGTSVFLREAGDPARPALFLLHGFPSSSRQYVRLLDRLAERWYVIAPDYPGFGQSDPLASSPTFDRLAEVTAAVIDTLGID